MTRRGTGKGRRILVVVHQNLDLDLDPVQNRPLDPSQAAAAITGTTVGTSPETVAVVDALDPEREPLIVVIEAPAQDGHAL